MDAVWAKGLRHEKNIVIAFQYTIVPSEKTKLSLAASNLYRLFINGDLIGYGPARAAHGYSRLDEYCLEKWDKQAVVITIEVHSANVNTYYVIDEFPFFAAEIRNGDELVASSHDFFAYHMTDRVQKVRRFSFQRSFTEIYQLQKNPKVFYKGDTSECTRVKTEAVDMNKILPRYVNFPKLDRQCGSMLEKGQIELNMDAEPWRNSAYTKIDPVRIKGFYPHELEEDSGEEAGQFVYAADWNAKQGGDISQCDWSEMRSRSYRIFDFGRTLTGFFALSVSARTETNCYILFDEIATEHETYCEVSPFRNACCNVIKYKLEAGDYDLIAFEANSARFATVVVTEGHLVLNEFGMITYENPDASCFEYDYGDSELNKIVSAAINTLAQNAVDILMDCPSRERAGWLCDSYFSGRAEALFTGKNLVEKSFLENYALYTHSPFLPEKILPMCYPADHNNGRYIPNWAMWYILELRSYWERTGDEAMLQISKEKVYGLVDFFAKYYNEYGLLENLESWVFVEWSKCNHADHIRGVNFPSNMLWASALEAVAELYDEPKLLQKSCEIRNTIRDMAWNGDFFVDNAVRNENGELVRTNNTTETCQYYSFYFGIADQETHAELFETLRIQFGPTRDAAILFPEVYPSNAIVGNYLRLEILLRYGYYQQVLSECREYFLQMAELTGTLWEHSRLNASLNHGFASVVAVYIDECVKRLAELQKG